MRKILYWSNGIGLWVVAIIIIVIQLFIGRSFDELGLNWPIPTLSGWALLATLVIMVAFLFDFGLDIWSPNRKTILQKKLTGELGFLPATRIEFLHYLFLAFSAAFCEEIIFRGYLLKYLFSIFIEMPLAIWWAILTQAFIFSIIHYYQGTKAVLKIFILAILLGIIYWLNGSIWWLIFTHLAIDIIGGTIGFMVQPTTNETSLPDS